VEYVSIFFFRLQRKNASSGKQNFKEKIIHKSLTLKQNLVYKNMNTNFLWKFGAVQIISETSIKTLNYIRVRRLRYAIYVCKTIQSQYFRKKYLRCFTNIEKNKIIISPILHKVRVHMRLYDVFCVPIYKFNTCYFMWVMFTQC